jgi:hypothetical protein
MSSFAFLRFLFLIGCLFRRADSCTFSQQPASVETLLHSCFRADNSAAATLAGCCTTSRAFDSAAHDSELAESISFDVFAALLEQDSCHDVAAGALGDEGALKMLR